MQKAVVRTQNRKRIPLIWRVIIGCVTLFVVLAGATIALGRFRARDSYECLQVGDAYIDRSAGLGPFSGMPWTVLFDMRTGAEFRSGLQSQVSEPNPDILDPTRSPDKKFSAFTYHYYTNNQTVEHLTLITQYIKTAGRTRVFPIRDVGSAWVDDGWYEWSPDSRWIAYHWTPTDGQEQIALATPYEEKHNRLISIPEGSYVKLSGWSADSAYFAISVWSPKEQHLTVMLWSAPDLQLRASTTLSQVVPFVDIYGLPKYPDGTWSPQGHLFAFATNSPNGKSQLIILSPEKGTAKTFPISGLFADPYQIKWSPDGRHIAISAGIRPRLATQISIFALDNTPSIQLNGYQIKAGDGIPSNFKWSADGQSIFYLKASPNPLPDFAAYRIPNHSSQILTRHVISNPEFAPDLSWVITKHVAHNRTYLEYFPFRSGTRVTISQADAYCSHFWPSADGKNVAFQCTKSAEGVGAAYWIRDDGRGLREATGFYQWLEGNQMLVFGLYNNKTDKLGIGIVNIETGQARRVISWPEWLSGAYPIAISADNQTIAVQSGDDIVMASIDGSKLHIVKTDLKGSRFGNAMVLSPDNKFLAISGTTGKVESADSIQVFTTDGVFLRRFDNLRNPTAEKLTWTQCN